MSSFMKKGAWNCPKEWRDSKGMCQLQWNCTVGQWKSSCGEQTMFATTIVQGNKGAWYAGLVILGVTITKDLYEHLSVMRQAPILFKALLVLQCCIAVNIGVLNASITAGSNNPVDILMNSMGLLILNKMDNIIATLFFVFLEKEEKKSDLFAENLWAKDQIFAKWLSLGHLGLVAYVGCWFSGLFQYDEPEVALQVLFYQQPYSFYVFPFIVFLLYLYFYASFCKVCQFELCFKDVVDEEDGVVDGELNQEESVDGVTKGLATMKAQGDHRRSSSSKYMVNEGGDIQDSISEGK